MRSFRAEEGLLYDTGHQLQTKDMVKVLAHSSEASASLALAFTLCWFD